MQQTQIRGSSCTLPMKQGISPQQIHKSVCNNLSPFILICPKTPTIFKRPIFNTLHNVSFLVFPMYSLTLVIPTYFSFSELFCVAQLDGNEGHQQCTKSSLLFCCVGLGFCFVWGVFVCLFVFQWGIFKIVKKLQH